VRWMSPGNLAAQEPPPAPHVGGGEKCRALGAPVEGLKVPRPLFPRAQTSHFGRPLKAGSPYSPPLFPVMGRVVGSTEGASFWRACHAPFDEDPGLCWRDGAAKVCLKSNAAHPESSFSESLPAAGARQRH